MNNHETIDTYDIYNIEYNDNILSTYYKIVDYCNPMYVNIHNNPNYSEFFNVIYKNIDVYNSSKYIKKIKKYENEVNIENEQEENYIYDSYEPY